LSVYNPPVRIYTKQGDTGETGLLYGGRVSKSSLRTEAYGTVDEAVSCLGFARSLIKEALVNDHILRLQRTLFTVGAELATAPSKYGKLQQHFTTVTPEMTAAVEDAIDNISAEVALPPNFIIPGASPGSAALDVARTVLRRAERRAVELDRRKMLGNAEVLRFLNRASDFLFMLARYEDRHLPFEILTGETTRSGKQT
ncbi:MAG: cob(I)yrinic acid a,c-diamide adenosyltransferase, partial [Dehalococcoidia bacterium]